MCFYMSMLALADTGKYNTEGCLKTGTQVQTGKGKGLRQLCLVKAFYER